MSLFNIRKLLLLFKLNLSVKKLKFHRKDSLEMEALDEQPQVSQNLVCGECQHKIPYEEEVRLNPCGFILCLNCAVAKPNLICKTASCTNHSISTRSRLLIEWKRKEYEIDFTCCTEGHATNKATFQCLKCLDVFCNDCIFRHVNHQFYIKALDP